tara:strand:- start:2166 stop:2414 length:249 start_codon:yes stop_codon:yes gene_type:complete
MASDSIVNYAFYSKKQEEIGKDIKDEDSKTGRKVRHNIYELISGKEVVVTEVSSNSNLANESSFEDMIFLGEVKRWVRVVFW